MENSTIERNETEVVRSNGEVLDHGIELTILAPMYNEEDNIQKTIASIKDTMNDFGRPWELLFVNDGSTDRSLEIAREWEKKTEHLKIVSYPVNCGRGKALRTGFEYAHGRYVITIDFDLSYSPDHILRIYEVLTDPGQMIDVVLGSAYMKGGTTRDVGSFRLFISKLGNKILRYAFPQKFETTTCVLRGYKKDVLNAIDLGSDGKEIHLEILSKVCALGFRVKEIPATLTGRKHGNSKFRFKKTAFSHVLFSLFEKPLLFFGFVGLSLIVLGFTIGLYVVYLRYTGDLSPNRPLISLIILLLVVGSQFFCFGFIASQNNYLRNEIYKLQRKMRLLEKKRGSNDPC